jgi:hypothetical protein
MSRLRNVFTLLIFLSSCYTGNLNKVSRVRPKYEFKKVKYPEATTMFKTDPLTDWDVGGYVFNYTYLPGYEGVVFDFHLYGKFDEYYYTDVIRNRDNKRKGHWKLKGDQLLLTYNPPIKERHRFTIVKDDRLAFMVPQKKVNAFYYLIEQNDSIYNSAKLQYDSLGRFDLLIKLDFLSNVAAYRTKEKK